MPEVKNILNIYTEASSLMQVGMMFLDKNGHIRAVNQEFSREIGYQQNQLQDKTIFEINPYLNLLEWRKSWQKLLETGTVSMESGYMNKEGRIYPVRMRGILVEIKGRQLCCALVENLLDANRYKDILEYIGELSQIAGWEWDLVQNELVVTSHLYTLMGVDPTKTTINAENATKLAKDILGEIQYEELYNAVRTAIKTNEPVKTELRLQYPSGTKTSVDFSAKPVSGEGGTTKLYGAVRNTSDEKAKIQPLELTQFTLDNSSEMIFWIREDGLFEYINNEALSVLGYTEAEAHSLNEFAVLGIDAKEWSKQWKSFKQRKQSSFEEFLFKKDGSRIPVEMVVNFIEHEGRALICKYARDISEEFEWKQELESAKFSVDNAVEMIFWIERDGKISYVNKAASRITGYSRKELLAMYTFDLNEEVPKGAWNAHWKAVKKDGEFEREMLFKKKDGSLFPVFIQSKHLEFKGKEYHCAFVRDYSRKKQKDSIIQLSQHTLEQSKDAIFWLTEDGHFHYYNAAFVALSRFSEEVLEQSKIIDFFPQYSMSDFKAGWSRLEEGEVLRSERILKDASGNFIPVEVMVSMVHIEGTRYSCTFLRDISFRKKSEDAIQKSEERFKSVVASAIDAIITSDKKGTILTWNTGAEKIFGWNEEEISSFEVSTILPDLFRGKKTKGLQAYAHSNEDPSVGQVLEMDAVRKNGERFPVEISIGSWQSKGEVFYCCIIRDIAERRKKEAELQKAMEKISELKKNLEMENTYLQSEIDLSYNFNNIISSSKNYKKILTKVEQVADTDATVLVLGETGTGKELLARAIHKLSPRADRKLIKVNCSALPENLFESELFGHEKGAFTGAFQKKVGRFELANNGTIFLDEIGEMPLDMQTKLLRVLQEGEFERVGGNETLKVDVRIIAATNRDLEKEVQAGRFREDLYYRLNVFPIFNIPLRDRREDIPLLVSHFVQKYSDKMGKKIEKIPQSILERFYQYNFPGNIRELENIIERAVIITKGKNLEVDFSFLKKRRKDDSSNGKAFPTFKEVQRQHIIKALQKTGGRVSGDLGAARLLNMNDKTLFSKMKKFSIEKEDILKS
jgi:PAS domain S-box-containing protein